MNGQGQRARGGRRRRRKSKTKTQGNTPSEPILIAARRPNSPVILGGSRRSKVAASAKPRAFNGKEVNGHAPSPASVASERAVALEAAVAEAAVASEPVAAPKVPQRRVARIVQLDGRPIGERELERRRLLQRFIESEGRSQISRAAEVYLQAGFDFPEEQEVQLQLLEHFNETRARAAITVLLGLVDREAPKKRPVFEQRLRRLEEYADEVSTREAAATLRRALRA